MSTPSPSDPALAIRLGALTRALLEQPSVIREEGPLCDWLQARLPPALAHQRVGNSLVVWGPQRGRPRVGLFGHIDTVPANPQSGPVRLEGERLYGLGASDMKGGLAVMWALLEDLPLAALPYDLVWVFYDQEEGPYAQNGLGPVLEQVPALTQPPQGAAAALAFCLEPTDNVVQLGAVGTLSAEVVFSGKAAHSARPWQGENAIHKAGPLLAELHALGPREVQVGGLTFREVMQVTLAQGGRARNIVPDRLELLLNYRFAPGRSLEQAQQDVLDRVAGRAAVHFTDLCPAGQVVLDNPLLQRFLACTGAPTAPKQAWTDVARLGAAGLPAVNFGPGLTSQAHQRDEYVELGMLAESYRMFVGFLGGV